MKKKKIVLTFLILAAVCVGMGQPAIAAHHEGGERQYYEIRTYSFSNTDQHSVVENYWENAAIPAMKKLGVGPVGVFTEFNPEQEVKTPRLVVLISYASLEQFATITDQLNADEAYLKAGAAYLKADEESPAYDRIESSLVHAFHAMPQLKGPGTDKDRIFEMREYEGHSEHSSNVKVQMFEEVEVELFVETGMTGVFYGRTLVGKNLPSLFYMLAFDDLEDKGSDWRGFFESPEWEKVSGDEKWSEGGVSGVNSTMLRPTSFSQI